MVFPRVFTSESLTPGPSRTAEVTVLVDSLREPNPDAVAFDQPRDLYRFFGGRVLMMKLVHV